MSCPPVKSYIFKLRLEKSLVDSSTHKSRDSYTFNSVDLRKINLKIVKNVIKCVNIVFEAKSEIYYRYSHKTAVKLLNVLIFVVRLNNVTVFASNAETC